MKKRISWEFLITRYPAFFPLILLVLSIVINFILQPRMFELDTLNGNLRVFLPLILLSVGQAIVLLGGGIDISVGGIVSIVNTILATRVGLDGTPELMWQYVLLSLFVGVFAGAINGFLLHIYVCSRSSPPTQPAFFMQGLRSLSYPILEVVFLRILQTSTAPQRPLAYH